MLSALDLMNTSAKWKIGRVEQGQPLLEVVTHHLGMSKKQAKRLLDARSVFVNHRRVWMARHPLQVGDEVEVVGFRPPSAPARPAAPPRLRILRETAAWLAVDKPAGLLTNGPDSLESLLRAQRQEPASGSGTPPGPRHHRLHPVRPPCPGPGRPARPVRGPCRPQNLRGHRAGRPFPPTCCGWTNAWTGWRR
jgi:hypothetical protein